MEQEPLPAAPAPPHLPHVVEVLPRVALALRRRSGWTDYGRTRCGELSAALSTWPAHTHHSDDQHSVTDAVQPPLPLKSRDPQRPQATHPPTLGAIHEAVYTAVPSEPPSTPRHLVDSVMVSSHARPSRASATPLAASALTATGRAAWPAIQLWMSMWWELR